jgi:hypothetical protein
MVAEHIFLSSGHKFLTGDLRLQHLVTFAAWPQLRDWSARLSDTEESALNLDSEAASACRGEIIKSVSLSRFQLSLAWLVGSMAKGIDDIHGGIGLAPPGDGRIVERNVHADAPLHQLGNPTYTCSLLNLTNYLVPETALCMPSFEARLHISTLLPERLAFSPCRHHLGEATATAGNGSLLS